jgi:predicted metal-dependent HD superfamily phosphohydrolase
VNAVNPPLRHGRKEIAAIPFDQIERTKWVHDRIVDTKKGKGSNATATYGEQTGCAVRASPEEVFVCKNAD